MAFSPSLWHPWPHIFLFLPLCFGHHFLFFSSAERASGGAEKKFLSSEQQPRKTAAERPFSPRPSPPSCECPHPCAREYSTSPLGKGKEEKRPGISPKNRAKRHFFAKQENPLIKSRSEMCPFNDPFQPIFRVIFGLEENVLGWHLPQGKALSLSFCRRPAKRVVNGMDTSLFLFSHPPKR